MSNKFADIDMNNLISGPLNAAIEANLKMAESTSDFIKKVGFDEDGKIRSVKFDYVKKFSDDTETSMMAPLLSIVPIPNLQVDEVNILFDMEVKQSNKE